MASILSAGTTTSSGLVATADTSGVLQLATNNGTTAVTVDTSQNVGIGTSSPSTYGQFAVVAGTNGYANTGNFINTSNGTSAVNRILLGNDVSNGSGQLVIYSSTNSSFPNYFDINQANPAPLRFLTNNTERARIDSSGNLLVGTTTDQASAVACFVKSSSDYVLYVQNTHATTGDKTYRSILGANTNNTGSFHFSGNAAGSDTIYIYGNGNIVNANNSYGTLSDIKLKENIVDASAKLDDVMKLKVRNFNFKSDPDHKQIGFIAQEVEEVFPSLIDNTTSPDNSNDVTKAIKTSVLIPILVKAIQELAAQVTALQSDNAALKAKVGI